MKIHQDILSIIFVLFAFSITSAQSDKKVGLGLSAELSNDKSWGGVASFSGEIEYSINKIYSISGLYRRGSGFGWFGAVEHKPEMDDDVSTYNEISSYLIYDLDDSFGGIYFGGGIGILWGNKKNDENYFMAGVPIVVGSRIKISNDFKIGLKFIGNINTKTIFTGIGVSLFFNVL